MNLLTLIIGGLGGPELIVIALIVLLLFGGKKVPELMRGLGKGIREFNNAKSNIQSEIKEGMREIESSDKEKEREKVSLKEEDTVEGKKS